MCVLRRVECFLIYRESMLGIAVLQMLCNEAILFSYKQVKHDFSLLRAYAIICGRFNITVN